MRAASFVRRAGCAIISRQVVAKELSMHIWARVAGVVVVVILLASFLAMPAFPLVLAPVERLLNGNFEDGFGPDGVAQGWVGIHQGESQLTWSAEHAEPAIFDGGSAQRLVIVRDAIQSDAGEEYIGVCQSVELTPGETYQLTIHGELLADGAPAGAGVAAQWGLDPDDGSDARAVPEWVDLPWQAAALNAPLGALRAYFTTFTAATARQTFCLRLYRAAGAPATQLALVMDGLSLRGSSPAPEAGVAGFRGPTVSITAPAFPVAGSPVFLHVLATHAAGVLSMRLFDNGTEVGRVERTAPATALEESFVWLPDQAGPHRLRAEASNQAGEVGMATQTVTVGEAMALVEAGGDAGELTPGWRVFSEGGQAAWGEDGRIRLEGSGKPLAGESCFAGIYREISGMRAGATYDLRIAGRLGEPQAGERWQAEYAIAWSDATQALQDLSRLNWQTLPWSVGGVGPLPMYTATLTGRAGQATLLLRVRRLIGAERCAGEWTVESVSLRGYQ
jgi:hypothetical protein